MILKGFTSFQMHSQRDKKTLPRQVKSIFRYDLDKLQNVLLNIHHGFDNLFLLKYN